MLQNWSPIIVPQTSNCVYSCSVAIKHCSLIHHLGGLHYKMRSICITMSYITDVNQGQQILMCDREFRELSQAASLNCQAGSSIDVTYVNYGRTRPYGQLCNYHIGVDRSTCGPQAVVTQRAKDACQGKSSCRLTYTGLTLWDTCPNTYKYFEVRYKCKKHGKA